MRCGVCKKPISETQRAYMVESSLVMLAHHNCLGGRKAFGVLFATKEKEPCYLLFVKYWNAAVLMPLRFSGRLISGALVGILMSRMT